MKRTDKEIIEAIRRVDAWLSPENLHCDGEISFSEARKNGDRLEAERASLVKELGREPTYEELYPRR